GLDAEPMFLLASTAGRLFLLLAVWYATRLVSDDVRVRRAGFVMVALAGGLASVAALLARVTGLPLPLEARELNDPELNTFLVLFTAPHLMFGLGLLLVAARLYADSWTEPGAWRWIALPATVLLL